MRKLLVLAALSLAFGACASEVCARLDRADCPAANPPKLDLEARCAVAVPGLALVPCLVLPGCEPRGAAVRLATIECDGVEAEAWCCAEDIEQ